MSSTAAIVAVSGFFRRGRAVTPGIWSMNDRLLSRQEVSNVLSTVGLHIAGRERLTRTNIGMYRIIVLCAIGGIQINDSLGEAFFIIIKGEDFRLGSGRGCDLI